MHVFIFRDWSWRKHILDCCKFDISTNLSSSLTNLSPNDRHHLWTEANPTNELWFVFFNEVPLGNQSPVQTTPARLFRWSVLATSLAWPGPRYGDDDDGNFTILIIPHTHTFCASKLLAGVLVCRPDKVLPFFGTPRGMNSWIKFLFIKFTLGMASHPTTFGRWSSSATCWLPSGIRVLRKLNYQLPSSGWLTADLFFFQLIFVDGFRATSGPLSRPALGEGRTLTWPRRRNTVIICAYANEGIKRPNWTWIWEKDSERTNARAPFWECKF